MGNEVDGKNRMNRPLPRENQKGTLRDNHSTRSPENAIDLYWESLKGAPGVVQSELEIIGEFGFRKKYHYGTIYFNIHNLNKVYIKYPLDQYFNVSDGKVQSAFPNTDSCILDNGMQACALTDGQLLLHDVNGYKLLPSKIYPRNHGLRCMEAIGNNPNGDFLILFSGWFSISRELQSDLFVFSTTTSKPDHLLTGTTVSKPWNVASIPPFGAVVFSLIFKYDPSSKTTELLSEQREKKVIFDNFFKTFVEQKVIAAKHTKWYDPILIKKGHNILNRGAATLKTEAEELFEGDESLIGVNTVFIPFKDLIKFGEEHYNVTQEIEIPINNNSGGPGKYKVLFSMDYKVNPTITH